MEIEFKFCIPPERLPAVEAALRQVAVKRTRLQARYFDTADHALAAQGIVLRLRKEGRRWVQTAKAAGQGVLARLEHNMDLGPAQRSAGEPRPDAQRHAGTPVGERLAQVLAASGQPLRPTYGTDIWRLTRTVRAHGCTAELALDRGRIHAQAEDGAPARDTPVRELELELLDGPVQGLAALAREWAEAHGLWFSTVSKAEAGLRLLHGQTQVPAVKARAPYWPADALPDGPALLRAVVAACLAQMLPNASEIAAGSEDGEQVHQLRIGIRRLRTALRELGPLMPDSAVTAWEPALATAFRALGLHRDGEAVMGEVQGRLLAAGGPPVDAPPSIPETPAPADVVRTPGFQAVLIAAIGFSAEEAGAGESGPDAQAPAHAEAEAAWAHVRARLDRLHRQARRAGKRFGRLSADERHRVRKRLKRLRYLAEFVAPLFGARRSARYLEALRPVQDALGAYNDQWLALDIYRQWTAHDPRAWFGVGWLVADEAARLRACEEALTALRQARPFWRDKPKAMR